MVAFDEVTMEWSIVSRIHGCKVHWARSWQSVRDRVPKSSDESREKSIFIKLLKTLLKLKVVKKFHSDLRLSVVKLKQCLYWILCQI